MVPVDQCEVDLAAVRGERGERLGEDLGRIADVDRGVRDLLLELFDLGHDVEGVNLRCVRGDAPQAAALSSSGLDGDAWA